MPAVRLKQPAPRKTMRVRKPVTPKALWRAQKSMAEAESAMAAQNEKLKALDGSLKRIAADLDELSDSDKTANGDLQHLGGQEELVQAVEATRCTMESARLTHGEKRGALDELEIAPRSA